MFEHKNRAMFLAVTAIVCCAPAFAETSKEVWNKAYTLIRKNQNNKALSILDKGIAENPESGELYFLRGALRADKDDYKNALSDEIKVLDYSTEENLAAAAFLNRARFEFLLNQNDAADRDYRKLAEFEPNLAIVQYEYAKFLFRTSKGDAATKHIEQGKKLEKVALHKKRNDAIKELLIIADTGKYAKRATEALQVNDIDRAISILNDGIKMTPDDKELQNMRVALLEKKSQKKGK